MVTIIHENALLPVVLTTYSHVHDEIGQRSSLSDLPMNTCACCFGQPCDVQDKITDLSVEVVLISIPATAALTRIVDVRIKKCDTVEVSGSDDRRRINCVSNQLSVVVENDGRADNVSTRRNVD